MSGSRKPRSKKKKKRKKEKPDPHQVTVTFFTCSSTIAGKTKADKGVDLIDAGASVLAWIGLAVVNVWKEKRATHTCVQLVELGEGKKIKNKKILVDENFWSD